MGGLLARELAGARCELARSLAAAKGTAFALSSLFLPFGQVVNVYVEYFYVFRPEVPPLGRLIRPGTLIFKCSWSPQTTKKTQMVIFKLKS